MPLMNLVIALIVVGVALYLINRYIPMASSIKTILNASTTPKSPVQGPSTALNQTRGVVWGAERPELLITETLAWHDRRTDDRQGASPPGTHDELHGGEGVFGKAFPHVGEVFVHLGGDEVSGEADVEAGGIIVEGDVQGNLSAADRIELKNTARYEGDLRASKLVVEEGAAFSGHVSVGPDSVKGGAGRPGGMGQQQHRPGGQGGGGGQPQQPQPQGAKQ